MIPSDLSMKSLVKTSQWLVTTAIDQSLNRTALKVFKPLRPLLISWISVAIQSGTAGLYKKLGAVVIGLTMTVYASLMSKAIVGQTVGTVENLLVDILKQLT